MLRSLLRVTASLPCKPRLLNQFQIHKTLVNFRFCSTAVHPTIRKISSGLNSTNIDPILIELADLDAENRETALRMILQKIQRQQLPTMTLLNQKYVEQALKHPDIFIDSNLFHIRILSNYLDQFIYKEEEEENNPLIHDTLKEINDAFRSCFEQYEKIEKGELSIKYELLLGKVYTNFYLYHSDRFIKGKEREQGLGRCCEMLRKIIELQKHLLEEDCRRTEQLQKRELDSDQTQEDKLDKIDRIKHHTLALIDLFAENILNLSEAMGQLYRYHQDQSQLIKGIRETVSNIEIALEFYNFLNSISNDSKYYFHLRMNKAELNFKAAVSSIPIQQDYKVKYNEARNQLSQEFDQIYSDAQKCLDKCVESGKKVEAIKKIAAVIMSVKMERLQRAQTSIAESIEEGLISEAQHILGKIQDQQTREGVSKALLAFSKQMADYAERVLQERQKRQAEECDK